MTSINTKTQSLSLTPELALGAAGIQRESVPVLWWVVLLVWAWQW